MNESRFDELFENIYGFKPKKRGASYELIAAAALKLIRAALEVRANLFVEGTYSREKYQIDAAIDSFQTAVEAKDYSGRGKKVGRPALNKFAGALQDLPFNSGIVASATDFSRPARKYAESTKANPVGKRIDLYHIRRSVEADEEGRLKSVVIKLNILSVDHKNSRFVPILTSRGNDLLKQTHRVGDSIQTKLEKFYRADGTVLLTIFELTSRIDRERKTTVAQGSWIPSEPAFMMIGDQLIEISELKYFIPLAVMEIQFVVEAAGKAQLLIRSEDGEIDKLLTDVDLKKITFGNDDVRA
jgi:hypothetical protein